MPLELDLFIAEEEQANNLRASPKYGGQRSVLLGGSHIIS